MSSSLKALLLEDHKKLDELVEAVREGARANVDVRTLDELWSRFAHALEAHLDLEERELFPLLPRHDAELAELRGDHAWLRRELEGLTILQQLHSVRDAAIEAFLDRLRRHAEREDTTLYTWVDRELPAAQRQTLARLHDHRNEQRAST